VSIELNRPDGIVPVVECRAKFSNVERNRLAILVALEVSISTKRFAGIVALVEYRA